MNWTRNTHGDMENAYRILSPKTWKERPFGRAGRRNGIIRRILKNYGVRVWNGCIWFSIGASGGILWAW